MNGPSEGHILRSLVASPLDHGRLAGRHQFPLIEIGFDRLRGQEDVRPLSCNALPLQEFDPWLHQNSRCTAEHPFMLHSDARTIVLEQYRGFRMYMYLQYVLGRGSRQLFLGW